ncbi:hypothetical protein GCM10029976_095480 [Kribbella albertanoniae]|uniref:Uncharacterized protein n=1 Tax=Kribbella albertanoniae TaxID=1266829 RepID=A0A4R4PU54_9ACTN|nr:hypothetical protein [Kribbella albertanoniae]TDC25922.1 hypothetical protein E1261_23345 [Kribbella albertanoniae]
MGFALTVAPLDGIDEPGAEQDAAWYEYCLDMFAAVNEHLASLGLPPHTEPRSSTGGSVHLGYRQPLLELIELEAELPAELEATFDHVLMAGPNALFVPVDLPEPVALEADGELFRLGSVPRLLFQSAWLQRLVGEDSWYDLEFATDLYGVLLDRPLEGFPKGLPLMEGGGTAGAVLSETLCCAAIAAYETNSSIRIC